MPENPLERRDVLKLAASACLLEAAPGCAPALGRQPASVDSVAARLDPAAADALLAKIDRRMAWIGDASLPDDVLPRPRVPRSAELDVELATGGSLVRKAVRTLYLTGRFLDMPDEMKVHPGVQARMRAIQPEMDDAVLGMTERLERMTPEDHRRVQTHLKNDKLFGDRLARVLEGTAVEDGLSFQRTFGLRSSVLHVTQRMAAQSPALVADPIVRKVRRIEAHPRSDAEQARRLAARVGEQAFWEHQQNVELLHEAWTTRLGAARTLAYNAAFAGPGAAGVLAQTTVAASASTGAPSTAQPPPSPGARTMGTGGIIMGLGLGSVLLGLICAGIASATSLSGFYAPALVLGVTIGPILLVVGLVFVIVGAVMKAQE